MKVFVTGASGWIGSAVVPELLAHGHTVLGLARSDDAAQKLRAAGAEVHRGSLDDPEGLAAAAAACDGVVHLAFQHDFSQYAECARKDRDAISAMAAALAGSGRPLVVTSGTMTLAGGGADGAAAAGGPGTEGEAAPAAGMAAVRGLSEELALGFGGQGVRASVVRLPPSVHGDGDRGFVPGLVDIAKRNGSSAYVGEGANRWPAVHRRDAAVLYRLAVEKGAAGTRFHAVADESVPFKDIAEVIGKHLNVPVVSKTPEEALSQLGFLGRFAGLDNPTSGKLTREALGWQPEQPGLLEDMAAHYFKGGPGFKYGVSGKDESK